MRISDWSSDVCSSDLVLMRGLIRAGRMVRLRVTISDQPGTLARVAREIGETGGNIVEIYHQRMFHDVPVKLAELDAVVETRDIQHVREIRSEEHTSELQSLMRISNAVFCLKKK